MSKSLPLQRMKILESLFQSYDGPVFALRFWDGLQWSNAPGRIPVCTLVFKTPEALKTLFSEPSELTLGEAFIDGSLDVEGDIFSVFFLAEYVLNRPCRLRQRMKEQLARAFFHASRWLKDGVNHSPKRDRNSISYHYDQPIEFYRPWLGRTLVYSCAYFATKEDSLEQAQEQKLDLICRKLRLRPLDRFLDIGCGWGGLVLHAASKYQADAHGITLSREQAEIAKGRIDEADLGHCCKVELRDYRELSGLQGSFDKIASVGMFEHVGLKNLPHYFKIAHSLLRPGGIFLNHGIARSYNDQPRRASFIDRYVFPDGQLVTFAQAVECAEAAGLEVRDVENLREHYDLTLRRWVENLQRNSAVVRKHVPEATYRIWLLYMAGSAAAFRRGDLKLYQIVLSCPDKGNSHLPLRREDWIFSHPPTVQIESRSPKHSGITP